MWPLHKGPFQDPIDYGAEDFCKLENEDLSNMDNLYNCLFIIDSKDSK